MHWFLFLYYILNISQIVPGLSAKVLKISKKIETLKPLEEPQLNLQHHNQDQEPHSAYGADPFETELLVLFEEKLVYKLRSIQNSITMNQGHVCYLYLSKYLKEFNEDAEFLGNITGEAKAKQVVDNPILSFKMIRRIFHSLLTDTMKQCRYKEEIVKTVDNIFTSEQMIRPNQDNLDDAVHALVTIQFMHGLNAAEDVRLGNLHHETHLGQLTFEDCVVIAKEVLTHKYTQLGYQWVTAAESSPIRQEFKNEAKQELKHLWKVLKEQSGWGTRKRIQLEFQTKRVETLELAEGETATYVGTGYCRGKHTHVIHQQTSKLACFHYKAKHPYFLINPLHVETIVLEPFVFQFHDFVTEKQIAALEWESDFTEHVTNVENERNTELKNIAHDMNQNLEIKKVIWKIETVTKLKLAMNATNGHIFYRGFYTALGLFSNQEFATGNVDGYDPENLSSTFGTMLIYTSNVTLGGNQAFYKIGAFAEPIKGSALFYYNYDPNGSSKSMLEHKTCPVILGIKEDIYVPLMFSRGTKLDPFFLQHLKYLK